VTANRPLRVLILCTGNSARSQMAEAVLNRKGAGRFAAESAGSQPAAGVNPFAIEALREAGIEWQGRPPRGIDALGSENWDIVITVCDNAAGEVCPVWPGHPVTAHWSIPDPAAIAGSDEEQRKAFADACRMLTNRIRLLIGLPLAQLDELSFKRRVDDIGRTAP